MPLFCRLFVKIDRFADILLYIDTFFVEIGKFKQCWWVVLFGRLFQPV